MDVVKDVCEKIGCKPKFINSGARGYQVRLGIPQNVRKIPIMQREQFKVAMEAEVNKLQKRIDAAGYPAIRASAVGSTRDVLAFLVPYETKMFEGALSPRFAKAALQAQKRLQAGLSPNNVSEYLQKTYGFTPENAQNVIQYLVLTRKVMVEGTMPGPSDQGGASTPPPHTGPSDSISAPTPGMNDTEEPALGTDKPQQGDMPDPKQMMQQNPELADFFAAMAKMKPEEIQNVTQMFTESIEDDEDNEGDVSEYPSPDTSRIYKDIFGYFMRHGSYSTMSAAKATCKKWNISLENLIDVIQQQGPEYYDLHLQDNPSLIRDRMTGPSWVDGLVRVVRDMIANPKKSYRAYY